MSVAVEWQAGLVAFARSRCAALATSSRVNIQETCVVKRPMWMIDVGVDVDVMGTFQGERFSSGACRSEAAAELGPIAASYSRRWAASARGAGGRGRQVLAARTWKAFHLPKLIVQAAGQLDTTATSTITPAKASTSAPIIGLRLLDDDARNRRAAPAATPATPPSGAQSQQAPDIPSVSLQEESSDQVARRW